MPWHPLNWTVTLNMCCPENASSVYCQQSHTDNFIACDGNTKFNTAALIQFNVIHVSPFLNVTIVSRACKDMEVDMKM